MEIQSLIDKYKHDLAEYIFKRRFTFPIELGTADKLSNSISIINQRWPGISDDNVNNQDQERPVFIFSAGWRSGSTLLQRLLISSGEVLLWGEPLGDAAFLPRMGYSLQKVSAQWPPDSFLSSKDFKTLSKDWIANLAPEISYLRSAHRSFFYEWLGRPALEKYGFNRWGFKEVRLSIDHARYLKWLFPKSTFIFIVRNPIDAFRSWKGNKWRSVWPGYYSYSAIAFARHWRYLVKGYIEGFNSVDGIIVRFEDLISGKVDPAKISTHSGLKTLDHSVLEKKIGTPAHQKKQYLKVSVFDRAIIRFLCRNRMKELNYSG